MMAGISPVLDLASASGMDLARTSDIVTDAMSMFKMEAKEAGRMADVLAATSSKTNTDVDQLGEALKYVGANAYASGMDIETTSAFLGKLADNGIKGSQAGTTLNAMLRDLKKSAKDGSVAVGDQSVALYDANGNMRDMTDVMDDLIGATAGMTDEQRDQAVASIFGAEALKGFNIYAAEGKGAVKGLVEELRNSEGAASIMAAIMNDNLNGSLTNLKSALEEVAIAIGLALIPYVEKAVAFVQMLADKFNSLDDKTKTIIAVIAALAAGFLLLTGPLLMIVGFIPSIVAGFAAFSTVIGAVITAIGALASPISIAIAAIVAIGVAVVAAYMHFEGFRDKVNAVWKAVVDVIKSAASAVVDYVKQTAQKMVSYWNENGEMIRAATQNVWSVIKVIIQGAMKVIETVLSVAWKAIQALVKAVWNNIKGVIDGALNVIMGLVKAFAGLFTGDFKAMWDGVVQLFKGAVELIWNAVQLMLWGRMLKGIAVFAGSFKGAATSMWSGIQSVFSKSIELVKGVFTKGFTAIQKVGSTIMNAIKTVISNVWNAIKNVFSSAVSSVQSVFKSGFNAIKSVASTVMNAIKTVISTAWNAIKTVFSGSVKAIQDLVKSGFNAVKSAITSVMNAIKSLITSVWNAIKSTVTAAVNGIKAAVTAAFNAIRSVVTSVMNAIRSLITSAWNAIKSVVTNVMNSIKSVIQAGWNGVKSTITSAMSAIKSAITSGFNAVVSAIRSAMSQAVSTIRSMMSQMVSAVTGAAGKFLQAGKDLVSGLISGIMSMAGAAIEAVAGVVGGVVDKAKSMLKIKSPSRVFMAIGDDTMQGWINGMKAREDDVSKVTRDVALLVKDITEHYKEQEKKIIASSNAEIAKIEKRSKEDVEKIHRVAAAKKRSLTKDENIKIERIKTDANAKIAEIEKKATTDSVKLISQEQADKLKEIELFVKDKNSLNELSLQEEAAIWQLAVDMFEDSTKEKVKAQENYKKATEAIDKELLANIKSFIEDKKSLEQLSLRDEARIWEAAAKEFQDGTKEKIEAQKEYAKALDKINKEITDTNKKYTDRMSKINEDFKKQEEDLTKKYQSSLEDRIKSLRSFAGTFDEFDIKTEKSGQDLLKNLSGQVDGFKKWQMEIEALSKRAIDDGLLEELRQMGPKALGELTALNSLSDEQLTKYSDLYREKSELARTQAEAELIGMKQDTEKQIGELRDIANTELSALQEDWEKEIRGITEVTSSELSTLEQIGQDAVRGLVDGLYSMHDDLDAAAVATADAILYAIKDVLDIHSPSREMRKLGEFAVQGFVDGLETSGAAPVKAMDSIAKSITDRTKSLNEELAKLESQKNEELSELAEQQRAEMYSWESAKASRLYFIEQQYQNGSIRSAEEYARRKAEVQASENEIIEKYYKGRQVITDKYEEQMHGIRVASEWKTYEALKEALDKGRENNEFTALEEMRIWREAADSFTEGTFQKEEAVKNFNTSQVQALQDLAEQRKAIQEQSNADLLVAEEKYAADVKAINDELIKQQEEVTAAYEKTVDDRAKMLVGFAGIFDEFKKQTEKSGEDLLGNLRGQVEGFKDWQQSIEELSNRAIDEGLLEELRQMGPKATGEIEALNKLTDEQLSEYSKLYQEKQKLAREQAEAELVGMKDDTEKQLDALRQAANGKLDELRSEFDTQIKEITAATNAELAKLEEIGREAGAGLLYGLSSQKTAIISEAQSIADGVNAALASIQSVGSLSFDADIRGLNVPDYQGVHTNQYNDLQSMSSTQPAATGGITQQITINSPQPTSPSDNARLMKQQARQLAMEWGV